MIYEIRPNFLIIIYLSQESDTNISIYFDLCKVFFVKTRNIFLMYL